MGSFHAACAETSFDHAFTKFRKHDTLINDDAEKKESYEIHIFEDPAISAVNEESITVAVSPVVKFA